MNGLKIRQLILPNTKVYAIFIWSVMDDSGTPGEVEYNHAEIEYWAVMDNGEIHGIELNSEGLQDAERNEGFHHYDFNPRGDKVAWG